MRVISWVTVMVYSVVLLAGLYYAVAGISPGGSNLLRLAGFVAGMALLFWIERRNTWHPARWLVARLVVYAGVAALDESGLSRVLFLLLPFVAYLELGPAAGLWLGAACLVALVGGYFIWVPGWYTDASYLSDVLMFAIGLILALTMAAVAVGAMNAQGMIVEMTAEVERTRLARDIHDSLGHDLTAIILQLETAMAFRDRDPEKADQSVAKAYACSRHALDEVRSAVRALRTDQQFDLPKALAELAKDMSVDLKVVGMATGSGQALTTLYRAAQESVTNARRHAQASTVAMTLTFNGYDARLEIVDDGRGFDPSELTEGFGLQGMRERTELIGGQLEVHSQPGEGTRITVTVPA
jgi:signal transduction histidine kinase